ncbi:MAG: hypothetical protein HDR24_00350 [Lachnospiraceae bacterium]|nr:hypothetical protein [Lachnospiraceae bacterium]
MSLTAREWLLLPKEEQDKREAELSEHECFLLRTEFSMIHFSEEEKVKLTDAEKEKFIHPKEYTQEEKEAFNEKCRNIFSEMSESIRSKQKREE